MRILLVEDNLILGDGIQVGFNQEGIGIDWVQNCADARLAINLNSYDSMILDLNLPDGSGLDLLKVRRKEKDFIPVLILTAKYQLNEKLAGFDAGADDYLTKPFELDELIARVKSLVRRSIKQIGHIIEHQDLQLDTVGKTLTFNGEQLEISHREFYVLQQLLENRGRILSRAQLEQNLYGWNADIESNAVEVHIHHLRKKLGSNFIKTIRGLGYTIEKQ